MRKLFFLLLLFPGVAAATLHRDTIRVDGNGSILGVNWDDNNTAGCAATASNYLRVNTDATTDTVSVDALVAICNTGDKFESYSLADFTRSQTAYDHIDSVRIRLKLWGTVATDSMRIGLGNGTDTVWSSRFVVTTTPTFYEFVRALDPAGNPWDNVSVNSMEVCKHSKLGTSGRIWSTEELAVIVSTDAPTPPAAPPTNSRFYFSSSIAAAQNIAFGLGLSTKWNDTTQAKTNNWRNKLTTGTAGSSIVTRNDTSNASPVIETHCLGMFMSDPLANQWISGSIKGQLKALESSNALDGTIALDAYVIKKDATLKGLLVGISASDAAGNAAPEMATTFTNRRHLDVNEVTPITLTGTACPESGRVVVELGFRDNSSGTQVGKARIGDPEPDSVDLTENDAQTTNAKPWVQFSSPLVFYSKCARSDTLLPNGNQITLAEWVESGGLCTAGDANKFKFVDEGINLDATDSSILTDGIAGGCATGDVTDSIRFANWSPVGTVVSIDSVRIEIWIKKATANADSVRFKMMTTATTTQAGTTLTTSYTRKTYTTLTKPGGGAWTNPAIDSLEGVYQSFLAASTSTINLTSIYAVVFWTDNTCAAADNIRRQRLERPGPLGEKNEKNSVPSFAGRSMDK